MPTVTPRKAHHIDNRCGLDPRPSKKKPEPEQWVSFEQLAYRMCATFGKPEGEAARHALLMRMGIEPVNAAVALEELRRYVEPKA